MREIIARQEARLGGALVRSGHPLANCDVGELLGKAETGVILTDQIE